MCEELTQGPYTVTVSDGARTLLLSTSQASALTCRPPCHTIDKKHYIVTGKHFCTDHVYGYPVCTPPNHKHGKAYLVHDSRPALECYTLKDCQHGQSEVIEVGNAVVQTIPHVQLAFGSVFALVPATTRMLSLSFIYRFLFKTTQNKRCWYTATNFYRNNNGQAQTFKNQVFIVISCY